MLTPPLGIRKRSLQPTKTSGKRDAILSAATRLFRQHGLRRTTIDDIARAAEVAKPTVYAHFEDKEALYVEVVRTTLESIHEEAGRAATAATLRDRVVGVLAAKFTRIFELLTQSPHASELIVSNHALAAAVIEQADARFLELLTDVVKGGRRQLGAKADTPGVFANRLLELGHGASYAAKTAREHQKSLQALVDLVL